MGISADFSERKCGTGLKRVKRDSSGLRERERVKKVTFIISEDWTSKERSDAMRGKI